MKSVAIESSSGANRTRAALALAAAYLIWGVALEGGLPAFPRFLPGGIRWVGAWLARERFGSHELLTMGMILLGAVAITFAKAARTAKTRPA
jgi:hypothetical protein